METKIGDTSSCLENCHMMVIIKNIKLKTISDLVAILDKPENGQSTKADKGL